MLTTQFPSPALGTTAVLVPIDGGEVVAGEVTQWSASDSGHVVTAHVEVGSANATTLMGHRVWLRIQADSTLMVLRAVARPANTNQHEVELTGVRTLAVETRRSAVRAQLARPIMILRAGQPAHHTTTLDLSTTGCRIALAEGQHLNPGDRLDVALTDATGITVHVRGEVVRVDSARREAGLSFIDLKSRDRDQLDHDILSWYTDNDGD